MEKETIKGLIKGALSQDSRCRNDDKYLVYKIFCMLEPKVKMISFDDWRKLPAPDTIKRFRADFQNTKGLYPPTDSTVLKRRSNEQSFRQMFKSKT